MMSRLSVANSRDPVTWPHHARPADVRKPPVLPVLAIVAAAFFRNQHALARTAARSCKDARSDALGKACPATLDIKVGQACGVLRFGLITGVIWTYAYCTIPAYGTGTDFSPAGRTPKAWGRPWFCPRMGRRWEQNRSPPRRPLQFIGHPPSVVRDKDAGTAKFGRIEKRRPALRPKAPCARLTPTFLFA